MYFDPSLECEDISLWATAYPLPFCRGCLFITYEVVALDKAVTIDTSAILQEKYKSYVYLKATPSDEKENLTAGTECHPPRLYDYIGKLLCFPF